jgi:hypothetical protein
MLQATPRSAWNWAEAAWRSNSVISPALSCASRRSAAAGARIAPPPIWVKIRALLGASASAHRIGDADS